MDVGRNHGIDLSLALIDRDLGHSAAMFVARVLVVFLKQPAAKLSSARSCNSRPAMRDLTAFTAG